MSMDDVLERACEVYISKMFNVFIEAVNAADGNEELITIAEDKFKAGVDLAVRSLAQAKQIVES